MFRSTIYDTFAHLGLVQEKRGADRGAQTQFLHERVLLVEDNELNLEIAKTLLEMHGIDVDTAENGKIAVDTFAGSPQGRYLAILMDVRMPVMDGLAATKAIRRLDRPDAGAIPIIAMTANAFNEDQALAYKAGMTGYLVKPLEIQALLRELEALCGK